MEHQIIGTTLPGVRFIAHTHPTPVNAVLCSRGAEEAVSGRLFPDEIVCCGERPVWVSQLADRPGEMGRLLHALADADVNCDLLYLDAHGRLVIGAEDMEAVSHLLS